MCYRFWGNALLYDSEMGLVVRSSSSVTTEEDGGYGDGRSVFVFEKDSARKISFMSVNEMISRDIV